MTEAEKVQYIETQVEFCQKTDCAEIRCPWCGAVNQVNEFCCPTFVHALEAVIQRQDVRADTAQKIDFANEVLQRAVDMITQDAPLVTLQ